MATAALEDYLAAFKENWISAGSPGPMALISMVDEIQSLRADAIRMRQCLIAMSEAEVGGGSFRTAAYDVATTDITAATLRERFDL